MTKNFQTLLLLSVTISAAQASDVRLFCQPIQDATLVAAAKMFGYGNSVHCALDVQDEDNTCLRIQADNKRTYLSPIECTDRASNEAKTVKRFDLGSEPVLVEIRHFEQIQGCDLDKLKTAAVAYGAETDPRKPETGAHDEANGYGWYKSPQGWGMPEYDGMHTNSNTFVRWVLKECGVKVKSPKNATGWDTKPSFPGPL